MIRHPWWLRKQSVCVIICPCRLLCILSDSSLLKQANSVEDCQACCGEIIILVVIYNKPSSASSTFFSRKEVKDNVFSSHCRDGLWEKCADNIWWHCSFGYKEALLMNIPPSTFWKLFQHHQKKHKITSHYKVQPAVEIIMEIIMERQNRVATLYF